MNVIDLQRQTGRGLIRWALLSILSGAAMLWRGSAFLRGVGEQFVGWGGVNLAIAIFGLVGARRRAQDPETMQPDALERERTRLVRLLWINAALDVLYILGGRRAMIAKGAQDERWRGRGLGIMIQGGFLLFFDVYHALIGRRRPLPDDANGPTSPA